MPACVETMFSVREVPWHGLGIIVEEAPTSADAIRLAGLDWRVEKKKIYTQSKKVIPEYFANTRDSDGMVLGIVKGRYQIVQNDEAFSFTDSLIGGEVTYETAGSLHDGKTVWLLAKMPMIKLLDDDVDPYICFTNTFDGTGSIKVMMTPTRVVCNNTLNLALKTARRMWSTRHTGDLQGKLEEAKETLSMARQYMCELNNEAVRLAERIVTDAELEHILDTMYPINPDKDSERKIRNANAMKDAFLTAYDMPDLKSYKGTGWGVVNAMADVVDHNVPNRVTDNYWENNWGKIIVGRTALDEIYDLVRA